MWSLLYHNTRLLILTISLILVWGISSFQILPRMEDPKLSQASALITTRFPGASAYRVESLVTEKIERELFEIAELKTIQSISRLGISTIKVEIKDEIPPEDKEQVWSLVRDKIADVTPELAPEVLEPQYQDRETRASAIIAALTWDLESPVNYAILTRLGQELEDELRILPGADKVDLFGVPDEEIIVEISPADLAALGLTAQELSQQIRTSDAKVAAGQLRNRNDLLIEVEAELDSLERIRQIPLHTANKFGQFARLDDIALVKKGIREPPGDLSLIDGKPAVVLSVFLESEQRIDQWAETARQTLAEFRERLPGGIGLQLIFDQSVYVESRLNGLFKNLLLGVICVVGSTLLLMGWKSALVVSSALPLSVLMVFGGMRILDIPLHQMSVTGLVIALGILIDNAVVVVDEVQQELKRGIDPKQAISRSVSYLGIPLLASNLTTVLTFMPLVLMPGPTGEFISGIALSVILALFSSLLLSLTIIPALSGIIHQKQGRTFPSKRQNRWSNCLHKGFSFPSLTWLYSRSLKFILGRPMLGILLALILPLTGFVMASSLDEQFFPPAERDQLQIEFELDTQASLEQTRLTILQAREFLLQHSEVVEVYWFLGKNAPKFYYNLLSNRQDSPNYAHGLVKLTAADKNHELIQSLQEELDQAFPSVRVLLRELEQGKPLPAPVELHLYGPDLETLKELGDQARVQLTRVDNITHTRDSLSEALPKLGLQVDEEQAQLAGFDNSAIAQQLNAILEGTLGGSILEDTEELPVRVRLSNRDRANLDQITTLDLVPHNQLSPENSIAIPLSSLGQINLVPETSIITRRNGHRVNTVQSFITAGVLPSTVLADFKQGLSDSNFQLPPGYSLEWGGESAESNEARGNLLSTVGILIVLMVAILVLSFNSFRSAGIILLVAIGSVGLALASLWFFGYPLGFMAILGTVGLIGVAINDSIVVLAAIRNDPQARKGDRPAIVKVIVRSTRHVLTTTITTIAGFIPLLLDGGEFWPPLAICIAGGVGGATLLALFFVPCAYILLIDRNHLNSLKFSGRQISYKLSKVMRNLVKVKN